MVPGGGAFVVGTAVPSLVSCGLSADADLVYRTLVTFGADSAPEVARSLGMPRRRVVDALNELAAREAVARRSPARRAPEVWSARPPREVVLSLRRSRLRSLADSSPVRRERALPDLGEMALGPGLRHLPSRLAARSRAVELASVVRHEHLAMNTERSFEPESTRSAAPLDRLLLGRGVKMRVVGLHPADIDPLLPHGRDPADPMPDYRQAPAVPMKLIVVDRQVALFPVDPCDFDRGYLEVAQPPVVSALVSLFERNWDAARKPPQPTPWPGASLSPREHTLVTLLAQGHTDHTAARDLRISRRSVTNIMRGLMDRFGVENRFQLGLALGALRVAAPPSHDTDPGEEQQ
jgi:DNA-binding CsgD family transcriptional regulator/sugar-specific transcriptional regulator TrmB